MAHENKPLVGVIMGSKSDLPIMEEALQMLDTFEVPYEVMIASAHRTPEKVQDYAETAVDRGLLIIIAAAGGAAALPGVLAAFTTLPIIGVPIKTDSLGGVDSLYSMVQMPPGIPVAVMAINGARNAALFAIEVLATTNDSYRDKLVSHRVTLLAKVEADNQQLQNRRGGQV